MICLFLHLVEAFPYCQDVALAVAKALVEKIIPIWGIPQDLHTDRRTHPIE